MTDAPGTLPPFFIENISLHGCGGDLRLVPSPLRRKRVATQIQIRHDSTVFHIVPPDSIPYSAERASSKVGEGPRNLAGESLGHKSTKRQVQAKTSLRKLLKCQYREFR